MGHVINPISHRLGLTRFWNSNWSLFNSAAYSYLAVQTTQIHEYLSALFGRITYSLFRRGIVLLNLKTLRVFNRLFVVIYLKSGSVNYLHFLLNMLFFKGKDIINRYRLRRGKKRIKFGWSLKRVSAKNNKRSIRYFKKFSKIKATSYFLRIKNNNLKQYMKQLPKYSSDLAVTHSATLTYSNIAHMRLAVLRNNFSSKRPSPILVLLRAAITKFWIKRIQNFIRTALKNLLISPAVVTDLLITVIPPTSISANFIAKYISVRLLQRFPVRKVVKTVISQLRKMQARAKIVGFKIACNGRFERRGRASHIWKNKGKATRTDPNLDVDYAIYLPILINSICAVKVWITNNHQTSKLFVL